jgi:alpha-tubulin suppressor-like RCC1 family protein
MFGTGKNIYVPFLRDTPCVLLFFVVDSQHMRRHIQKLTTIASVLMLLCVSIVHADVGGGSTSISRERIGYLSAGDTHTCVVLVDNSVKCFGLGNEGQLGNESTSNIGDGSGVSVASSSAISLGLGRSARAIATGTSHTCALLDNLTVKCWGSGLYGRTGYGDSNNRGDNAGEMGDALSAVDLGSGRNATMIAVGSNHSCALLDNATVKCWGRSNSGQLGYNDTVTRGDGAGEMGNALPAISFAAGRSATAIAAGASHTCALLDNAQVVCWGDNAYGQLGQGNMDNIGDGIGPTIAATPTIDVGTGRTAVAISAGDLHTCALLDNATVKCWGASANGRLGTGDTIDIGDDPNEMGDALLPISLGTGVSAIAVTAGGAHTCVLLNTAVVKCFGNGTDGRLGYGNQNNLGDGPGEMGDALAAVNLGTGRTVLAVSAGLAHTCAMLDNSTVKCWGNGGSGRRGSGNTSRAGITTAQMGDNLVALSAGALINTGTTTTTTTTTTVPPTTTTSTTTSTTTTTTVPPTTTTSTTTTVPPTTTTSTTTSTTSTTTVAPPVYSAPSTTTTSTSVAPTTTTIPRTVVQPLTVNAFDNSSYALSSAQKLQLNKLASQLHAGDAVTCVAYQESNALNLLSRLTVKRSQSVCTYLSTRVRGLVATPSAQFAPSATVQITASKSILIRGSSSLLRKVVVTAKPGP